MGEHPWVRGAPGVATSSNAVACDNDRTVAQDDLMPVM